MNNFFSEKRWFDVAWLTIVIVIANVCFLGRPAFFSPDEGRYAEIAREMLTSHQFLIPHLDGIIYLEKPPLSYWVNAGAIQLLGESEWAVRSVVALSGLLGCLASYLIARKLFNRRVGILSAFILSSSTLYFIMSHAVTTDMLLTLFLTSSLYSFLWALQQPATTRQRRWLWVAYLFSGLAVMTKGLIGLVFPVLIIMFWIAITKRWFLLREMRLFSGALIIAILNFPWLVAIQKQVPDFFHFYFIEQHIARYATPIAHREMALGTYILVFLCGLFPWIVWLPQNIKQVWRASDSDRFAKANLLYLLLWPSVILLFFSASHSILVPYLLPVLPPVAMLIGLYMDNVWEKKLDQSQRMSVMLFALICGMSGFSLLLLPYVHPLMGVRVAGDHYFIAIAASVFIAGAIAALFVAYRGLMCHVFTIMLCASYLSLIFLWGGASSANERSIKPLALMIKSLLIKNPEAMVVNYGDYHQELPYYTQRLVMIVGWKNELTFGFEHQKAARHQLIESPRFWQLWHSKQRLYVVMGAKSYATHCHQEQRHCYFIAQTANDVLISNMAVF